MRRLAFFVLACRAFFEAQVFAILTGLVEEKANPEKAQKMLERIVPPDKYISFHLNLIRHGREVCHARGPRHEKCCLQGCCAYVQGQKA